MEHDVDQLLSPSSIAQHCFWLNCSALLLAKGSLKLSESWIIYRCCQPQVITLARSLNTVRCHCDMTYFYNLTAYAPEKVFQKSDLGQNTSRWADPHHMAAFKGFAPCDSSPRLSRAQKSSSQIKLVFKLDEMSRQCSGPHAGSSCSPPARNGGRPLLHCSIDW